MSKNHPKIYPKLPEVNVTRREIKRCLKRDRDIYWLKGRVKPRQNNLHVYPRLKWKKHSEMELIKF